MNRKSTTQSIEKTAETVVALESVHQKSTRIDRNKMDSTWNLRKYRAGDEQAIFELLNAAYGKWYSLEYWKWKFEKNPAGSPIIWLAEHDGKIVGHYGIIPIRMKIGNSYMTGSFSCDAATHPEYQGKGVFSSIVNKCYLDAAENEIPLTYGFANVNLGPTYKRYEWRGHICFMVDLIKVPGKAHRLGTINANLKIERISRFDERIDRFWEKISKNFQIIVLRDQRYLNWRYVNHPVRKYVIYAAVKDHRILGYCVVVVGQYKNLKTGVVADILGFQDNCDVVGHLIQRAVEHFKEQNVDAIRCRISEKHPYKAIFRKAGFITDPNPQRALYATINLRGSSIDDKAAYSQALIFSQNHFLKEKRNWLMISGDGD